MGLQGSGFLVIVIVIVIAIVTRERSGRASVKVCLLNEFTARRSLLLQYLLNTVLTLQTSY